MNANRFIIGDPSFLSFSGHCFEYIQSLAEPLRTAGHEVVVAGNRGLATEVSALTGARGVFTYWCDARPTPPGISDGTWLGRRFVRHTHERTIRRDLAELDAAIAFRADDIFIVNTLRHWPLRGLVDWIESLPDRRAPRIALILHFTARPVPGGPVDDTDFYRDGFRRIETSRHRDRFVLLADAQGLVDEYRAISPLEFRVAPIPHVKAAATEDFVDDPARPLTLAYVGEARLHKGFHLLPHVVAALDRHPRARPHRFEIQSFIHDPGAQFYRIAMDKMAGSTRCIFLPEQLDGAAYDAFLRRADIVLIPYLLDNYYVQTSGAYSEAISLAKPVVASMGTWMAAQIRQYGGGLTFPPGDQQSLLEAASRIIDNFPTFKAEAIAASRAWHEFHTAGRLLAMITEGGRS